MHFNSLLRRGIWLVALLLPLLGCASGEGHVPTEADAKAVNQLVKDVDLVVLLVQQQSGLADRPDDEVLTASERQLLFSIWAPYLDHDRALTSYQWRFLDGWQNAGTTAEESTRALAVGLMALSAQVDANLEFLQTWGASAVLRTAMNDPALDWGIGAGEYDRVLRETARPHTMLTLQLATSALERRLAGLTKKDLASAEFLALGQKALKTADKVEARYDKAIPRLMATAIGGVTQAQLDEVSQVVVTKIAEWMGDTRLRSKADSLITPEQIDWLQTQLDPGDVMLERRNWYLSNLGLPGFWPHAEFYLGTPDELAAAFDQDPEVLQAFGAGGLTAYLQKTSPEVWAAYVELAADGRPHRVAEAISEGSVFSSLHEAAQADYLGAMRPRLSPLDRARAVAEVFAQHGKPYDFDFDFLTQSKLVCSELVYVAYLRPQGQGTGLLLPLTTVLGRVTLPPNDIAALFDAEAGTPTRQMDFVAFLDGRESSKSAIVATEADLRASWRRPKWDLSQQ
jgi:hypothetical protein